MRPPLMLYISQLFLYSIQYAPHIHDVYLSYIKSLATNFL